MIQIRFVTNNCFVTKILEISNLFDVYIYIYIAAKDAEPAKRVVSTIILQMPRVEIVDKNGSYAHCIMLKKLHLLYITPNVVPWHIQYMQDTDPGLLCDGD